MKNFSNRIWVLVLGVLVALVIAVTLILGNTSKNLPTPVVTQKPASVQAPSVLLEKVLKTISARILPLE